MREKENERDRERAEKRKREKKWAKRGRFQSQRDRIKANIIKRTLKYQNNSLHCTCHFIKNFNFTIIVTPHSPWKQSQRHNKRIMCLIKMYFCLDFRIYFTRWFMRFIMRSASMCAYIARRSTRNASSIAQYVVCVYHIGCDSLRLNITAYTIPPCFDIIWCSFLASHSTFFKKLFSLFEANRLEIENWKRQLRWHEQKNNCNNNISYRGYPEATTTINKKDTRGPEILK